MTTALANEMDRFPGGSRALAESLRPGIEALRPMRWPADRLDTLGGYVTYHNLTLFTLALVLYAAVQGAAAVRGGEEAHSLEEILATGWSRRAVVRDRAAGFLLVLLGISLGLAAGVAAALASAGQPNLTGSLVALLTSGLAAMVGYGLGLLVSQLTGRARTASGVAVGVLVALYVLTNVWELLGPFGVVRFVSPFYWANASRGLVPGERLDLPATAALVVSAGCLVVLGGWAFGHRDYGGVLWARRRPALAVERPVVQRRMLDSVWRAGVLRGRLGMMWWALSGAAFAVLVALLEPTVMDVWSLFSSYVGMAGSAAPPEAQYLSFAGEIIMPFVAAYVLTQSSGWVADLEQGRVEAILSAPVSWARLVGERILTVLVGATVLTAGAVGGLVGGAAAVGAPLDPSGLARLGLDCLLLAAALAGVASLVVVGLRSTLAVTVLAVFVALSYLLGVVAPMLRLPDWAGRLSVFTAFGHPYLEWPAASGLLLLAGLTVVCGAGAAVLAGRTPKVSGSA